MKEPATGSRKTIQGEFSLRIATARHCPLFLFLLVASVLAKHAHVRASGVYPVYYDSKADRERRPLEGEPEPELYWDEVTREHYLYDLGDLTEPGDEFENKCKNMFLVKYGTKHYDEGHRQSPVQVQKHGESSDYCEQSDNFEIVEKGDCDKVKNVFFATTPYGLKADFRGCNVQPQLNFYPNNWILDYMFIKVPGEHQRHKTILPAETFGGEIHLVHRGLQDPSQIGIIAIWLKINPERPFHENKELQKYIRKWLNLQEEQYEKCGAVYDMETCELKDSSFYSEAPSGCEPGCCTRNLRNVGLNSPEESQINLDELKRLQKRNKQLTRTIDEMEQEMEALKVQLQEMQQQSLDTDDTSSHRALTAECGNNKFCPNELWKKTESSFYKYQGSLTHPPCTENVEWRVMRKPLYISQEQMENLEYLVAKHLDPYRCTLATVGRRRRNSCLVDVNRMVQYLSVDHNMEDCVNLGPQFGLDGLRHDEYPYSEPRPPEIYNYTDGGY